MRADGLAGSQRVAFGLVDPPFEQEQLGEPTLALAERGAVFERRQDADRVAVEAFGLGQVALVPGDPGRVVEGAAERPGGTRLREVLAGGVERRVGVVELAAVEVELSGEAERTPAGLGAAALLREQDRLLDERRGAIELQAREIDARQLVGGLALVVLPVGLAREVDRLLHQALLLGKVTA